MRFARSIAGAVERLISLLESHANGTVVVIAAFIIDDIATLLIIIHRLLFSTAAQKQKYQ